MQNDELAEDVLGEFYCNGFIELPALNQNFAEKQGLFLTPLGKSKQRKNEHATQSVASSKDLRKFQEKSKENNVPV